MYKLIWRVLSNGLLALALTGNVALAAGQGDGDGWDQRTSKLAPVQEVIERGDYNAAIEELNVLHEQDPENPDVLNLLGFSYRKLGDFDNALRNYQAALALNPKHRDSNEYLGELYLQTGQLDKAEERLAVLDRACFFGCKQYSELKAAIEAYKKENGVN